LAYFKAMARIASGCSKIKKTLCTELPQCKWVISKGCQVAPIKVAKVEKSKVVKPKVVKPKIDNNDLFPGVMIGAVPKISDVKSALRKAHQPFARSKKNLIYNEDDNNMVELYELLAKTGAVSLTLDVAKQYIGTNLVMFSDFDLEMENIYATEKLSELSNMTIAGLDTLTIISVEGKNTVNWKEGRWGEFLHDGDTVCRKGYDTIFVWLKKTSKSPVKSVVKSPVKSVVKSPVKSVVKSPVTVTKKESDRSKRPSPPFPAKEHAGSVMSGNDGRKYISIASKIGVYSWKLVK
jgi:hypothetical protein